MPVATIPLIKELRELTGAGMSDCKNALEATDGDVQKAIQWLREKGISKAAKRAGRETTAGVIESYLHRTSDFPPQVGTLVELNCETDFVAKSDDFRTLARELAMHIAAAAPRWIEKDEVPQEVVEQEREIYRRRAEEEGKPAQAIERIVEGGVNTFFKENVLLEQPWVREQKTPIKDVIAEAVSKLQENITVRRFTRFSIKES